MCGGLTTVCSVAFRSLPRGIDSIPINFVHVVHVRIWVTSHIHAAVFVWPAQCEVINISPIWHRPPKRPVPKAQRSSQYQLPELPVLCRSACSKVERPAERTLPSAHVCTTTDRTLSATECSARNATAKADSEAISCTQDKPCRVAHVPRAQHYERYVGRGSTNGLPRMASAGVHTWAQVIAATTTAQ